MRRRKQARGEVTRERVLKTALGLFRQRGFDGTTMRDIARAAGLSLGAAYHYFPSKDALVMAYYEWVQAEHEGRLPAADPNTDLRTRLSTLLHTKLELLRRDRRLLATLFRNLGDLSHPLSVFSRQTAAIRRRSVAQFRTIFEDSAIPEEMRDLLGRLAWLAHLGIFLFFIHDGSPGQAHTRKLVDALVDLVTAVLPFLVHPAAGPLQRRIRSLFAELALTGRTKS